MPAQHSRSAEQRVEQLQRTLTFHMGRVEEISETLQTALGTGPGPKVIRGVAVEVWKFPHPPPKARAKGKSSPPTKDALGISESAMAAAFGRSGMAGANGRYGMAESVAGEVDEDRDGDDEGDGDDEDDDEDVLYHSDGDRDEDDVLYHPDSDDDIEVESGRPQGWSSLLDDGEEGDEDANDEMSPPASEIEFGGLLRESTVSPTRNLFGHLTEVNANGGAGQKRKRQILEVPNVPHSPGQRQQKRRFLQAGGQGKPANVFDLTNSTTQRYPLADAVLPPPKQRAPINAEGFPSVMPCYWAPNLSRHLTRWLQQKGTRTVQTPLSRLALRTAQAWSIIMTGRASSDNLKLFQVKLPDSAEGPKKWIIVKWWHAKPDDEEEDDDRISVLPANPNTPYWLIAFPREVLLCSRTVASFPRTPISRGVNDPRNVHCTSMTLRKMGTASVLSNVPTVPILHGSSLKECFADDWIFACATGKGTVAMQSEVAIHL